MILKQYNLACLSHFSYLVGDAGVGVVVDPQRDVDHYLRDAESAGLRIEHVLLTHFHADFVAGHLELRERTGATIHLGRRAEADFAFQGVGEGDILRLGSMRLEFLETPGHTPEGICILVFDEATDPDHPHAVLTGDTLFLGDVGRPDLLASVGYSSEELAGMLYDSLHQKLLPLPDATLVYPAHGAGSACGKNMSSDSSSTLGVQRAANHALQPMSRDDFISRMTDDLPAAPAYFSHDAVLNRQERPTLSTALATAVRPLDRAAFEAAVADGAQVLDTRSAESFAQGHRRGSINIGLGGRYASWAGTVLALDRPIVLVCDPGTEEEAALRLARVGLDAVRGYAAEGIATFPSDQIESLERLDPTGLAAALDAEGNVGVLDLRNPGELDNGEFPSALNIPLAELQDRLDEVPRDRELVLACAGGYRSMIGASLLRRAGFEGISDLAGGHAAWRRR